MAELLTQQYDALMSEYKSLRNEIVIYAQRSDTTINLYLTVVIAAAAYTITMLKDPNTATLFMKPGPEMMGAYVAVGTLNALVILRLQTFYLAAISMAQYTNSVLRSRIVRLIQMKDVMEWDTREDIVPLKKGWLDARSRSQRTFGVLATLATVVTTGFGAYYAFNAPWLWVPVIISGVALFMVAKTYASIRDASKNFGSFAIESRADA